MIKPRSRRSYRTGAAIAFLTAFATVWTTIVRDDGSGEGFFMVILAAAVGAIAAGFRAAGMARAMAGVAVMQVLLCALVATEPRIIAGPNGATPAIMHSIVLTAMWLASAFCFARAAGQEQ